MTEIKHGYLRGSEYNQKQLQQAAEVICKEFKLKRDWYNAMVASISDVIRKETGLDVHLSTLPEKIADRIIGIEYMNPSAGVRKYKTNPCEIEAVQWTGNNLREVFQFCKDAEGYSSAEYTSSNELVVLTAERKRSAVALGDYIIKGLCGGFYPCEEAAFHKKYSLLWDKPWNL